MTILDLKIHLSRYYKDDEPVAGLIWTADDVKSIWPKATKHQVAEVLNEVERTKDASLGISWDTILWVVGDVRRRYNKKRSKSNDAYPQATARVS